MRGIKSFIDDNGVITDLGHNKPNSDQSEAPIGQLEPPIHSVRSSNQLFDTSLL